MTVLKPVVNDDFLIYKIIISPNLFLINNCDIIVSLSNIIFNSKIGKIYFITVTMNKYFIHFSVIQKYFIPN
jgi:hypothetical protein